LAQVKQFLYPTEADVIEQVITDQYALYRGDCVQVLRGIPDNSIHCSVSSWPFCSLYSYTDAVEDFSNIRTREDFFKGIDFLLSELHRVMMPGRIVATHCMQIPLTNERDGVIGLYDFRGDIIRAYEKHGFVYHSEVCIWKDPLIAATRTHAIGLAHKQLVKDSAMCRQGIPDYLVVMRKRGANPEPVSHFPAGLDRWIGPDSAEPIAEKSSHPGLNKYSHEVWQRYASPVWFDINPSDTLQRQSAREDEDSRHICPLQLTVIRRALELWSNPGDVVFDPFGGIGSTGYVAIQEGRRAVMSELKESYFNQMTRNMANAVASRPQQDMFTGALGLTLS
jgi:DNA modification methylase